MFFRYTKRAAAARQRMEAVHARNAISVAGTYFFSSFEQSVSAGAMLPDLQYAENT